MAQCTHFRICGLEGEHVGEDGFCILHSPDPEKDQAAFDEALGRHKQAWGHNYRHVVFVGPTGFDDITFDTEASFRNATFWGEASFFQATFRQKADFRRATFSSKTSLKSTAFNGLADFRSASFGGEASFRSASFREKADFHSASFRSVAYFSFAAFSGEASFSNAAFNDRAYFRRATLSTLADFRNASFSGVASFRSTAFNGLALFVGTSFSDKAYFSGATFSSKASLKSASFNGLADFSNTAFGGEASFNRATFHGEAYFRSATFSDLADFSGATFLAHTLFAGPAPDERKDPSHKPIFADSVADFRQVRLDPLDALRFRNADLRRVRLLDTDVRKITFTAVRWPGKRGGIHLYDELLYTRDLETRQAEVPWPFRPDEEDRWAEVVPWGKLEVLYRQLKQNYEENKDYSQGGNFHYREKEMQRRSPDCPWGRRLLLTLYKHLGGYGERVGPPLVALLALTGGCFLLYAALSQAPVEALLHSLETAFLFRPGTLQGTGLAGRFIQLVQTVMSPLLLGLLALSIRQRVKR